MRFHLKFVTSKVSANNQIAYG